MFELWLQAHIEKQRQVRFKYFLKQNQKGFEVMSKVYVVSHLSFENEFNVLAVFDEDSKVSAVSFAESVVNHIGKEHFLPPKEEDNEITWMITDLCSGYLTINFMDVISISDWRKITETFRQIRDNLL